MALGENGVLSLVGRLAGVRTPDDRRSGRERRQAQLDVRGGLEQRRLAFGRADDSQRRRLVRPRLGRHRGLQDSTALQACSTGRLDDSGLSSAKFDERHAHHRREFVYPHPIEGSEPGAALLTRPLDQQALGQAIQGDDGADLPWAGVQEESSAAAHGRRNPRPSSSDQVS